MKTYRNHYCSARHRTFPTLAKCLWPRAEWIIGNGPVALLAHCGVLTVSLYPNRDELQPALDMINRTGCGHRCGRRHEIIQLPDPAEALPGERFERRPRRRYR